MTRLFLMIVGLAFVGSLVLVGCEPPVENKPAVPKVEPPKAPEKPAVPPAPPVPDKKTGALNIPGAAEGVASVNAAATKVAAVTTCSLAGCTEPSNPSQSLVKDGKPLMFCCADCMSKYKKANNIQ